ncbi:MAG: transporter substrate-binding domain-containing protein [Oscillospiraceae bacterium]|nr:transporter substrate-binding domain-containing protein [Oscillospiraceae bacterium]
MKKIKSVLCILLALSLVFAFGVTAFAQASTEKNELDLIKEAGVLTVALSPDFAPMEFVDSSKEGQDQYVGFDVTLAKYIAEELGVELEIMAMSFDACQTAVAMDAVDMSISGYSWTESRAENFELSDYYYAGDNETAQVLLIREEDADKYTKPEDFAGVDVGAQNASLQMQLVTEQLPDAKPYTIGEIGVGVMELQAGNIEALAVADGNADAILVNNEGLVKCVWQFDVAAEYEANVIMMHKGETALCEAVNEALAKAYDNGYYAGWYEEAKEMAGLETAEEVSIEDEVDEEAAAEEDAAEEAAEETAAG